MELPAVDFKYKCPECSHDTYKRAQFIYHAKTVHSRDYEIFYQCIGCRKRFEQMRDCNSHCQACNRVQKAADVQADKGTSDVWLFWTKAAITYKISELRELKN